MEKPTYDIYGVAFKLRTFEQLPIKLQNQLPKFTETAYGFIILEAKKPFSSL